MAHCMRWTGPPLHWTRWGGQRETEDGREWERETGETEWETHMRTQMETVNGRNSNIKMDNREGAFQEIIKHVRDPTLRPCHFWLQGGRSILKLVKALSLYTASELHSSTAHRSQCPSPSENIVFSSSGSNIILVRCAMFNISFMINK